MNKKGILVLLVSAALIVGVVVLVTLTTKSTTVESTDTETDTKKDSTEKDASVVSDEKKAAEELIGETISRKKVKKSVGEWEKFEMSSAGCERGVYAGRFYYEDFIIFSRTYNKGKTFHIVSVNE